MFQPLQDALSAFFSYIPQLIGAVIILVIGYVIARVLRAVVGRVLQGIGFDGWMERGGHKAILRPGRDEPNPGEHPGHFGVLVRIYHRADDGRRRAGHPAGV